MRRVLIAACSTALGGLALLPGTAGATVTCTLVPDQTLTVNVDATSAQASLVRQGSDIQVHDGAIGASPVACTGGPATVTNTDQITVNDTAVGPHNVTLLVSLQGGPFAPGQNVDPPAGSADTTGPEIEIVFVAGDPTDLDTVEIDGSDEADDIDVGEGAVTTFNANLNPAADGASPDCDDVTATLSERAVVQGRGGDDDLNATACQNLPNLQALDPVRLEGNNQADFLRGGPGADEVLGGTQDDNVNGGAGEDTLDGSSGDDKLDGGTGADGVEGGDGTDRVLYEDRTTPLTVTIGNGGADDGGSEDQAGGSRDNVGLSVEHVTGGSAGDSITGSAVRNVLNGGLGDDFLLGGEGNDDLEGEGGNDSLDGGGGNDDVSGADGTDSVRGSGGADDLFGGSAADRLLGGAGADFLKGQGGKQDVMSGEGGNDKLAAKDGKKDKKINCGKGKAAKESAKVDRKQDPPAKSC